MRIPFGFARSTTHRRRLTGLRASLRLSYGAGRRCVTGSGAALRLSNRTHIVRTGDSPMSNLEKSAKNGVNVDALLAARAALTQAPEAAQFKWRATSEWLNGTHSRHTIAGFHGLGAEQKHRQSYQYDTDHPEIFAS